MVEAATSAVRSPTLRCWYERIERRRGKKIARVALARRLLTLRGRVLRHLRQQLAQERGERAVLHELRPELPRLLLVRELPVQKEVRDLLVLGAADELVDVVAAVDELAVLDEPDGGGGGDDAFQAPGNSLRLGFRHAQSFAQVSGGRPRAFCCW